MEEMQLSEKKKENLKKALQLKKRLEKFITSDRFKDCGRPFTFSCRDCNAISVSKGNLRFRLCGKRFCPICQMIHASENSRVLTQAIIKIMSESYKNNQSVIPVVMAFTMPHSIEDPLSKLIFTIKEAWKKLREGKYGKFWKEYFIGDVWNLEMPWNPVSGWHVHIHSIGIRHLDKGKIPQGTHRWTGVIQEPGVRTHWFEVLQKSWAKHMNRPYPNYLFQQEDIEKTVSRIEKAKVRDFEDLLNNHELSMKQKLEKLPEYTKQEIQKFMQEKDALLGKPKAPQVDVKALFYEDSNGKRIPITCFIKKEIFQQIKTDCFI